MKTTTPPRPINARGGARPAPEPAGQRRPRDPLASATATPIEQCRTDPGFDRWSPALTLGLALASPQTALLVARLLGPRTRRGLDA